MLLAAREEAESRCGDSYRPRTALSIRSRTSLDLPLATSQPPVRPSKSLQRCTSDIPPARERLSSDGRRWLSGEIDEPAILRSRSKPLPESVSSSSEVSHGALSPRSESRSSGSIWLTSGPLGRALSAQGFNDSSVQTNEAASMVRAATLPTLQVPTSRPIPSRFTYAARNSAEPASQQLPSYQIHSPRSSTSSKAASFRWSMSSRETTSTACSSRTSSQQTPKAIPEALEPSQTDLSISEEQEEQPIVTEQKRHRLPFGHRKDQISIDSIDSLSFELLSATDFPVPPRSRKGSIVSTASAVPSSQGSFSGSRRTEVEDIEPEGRPQSALALLVQTSAPMTRASSTGSGSRSQQSTGALSRAILNANLATTSRRPSGRGLA